MCRPSWKLILLGAALLPACRRVPTWWEAAPLIGTQVQDDLKRKLYLPQAPQRVAIATSEALPLWRSSKLDQYIVAGCYGDGEDTRVFYLSCEDSIALSDALYKAKVEWVWTSRLEKVGTFPESKVYVFRPQSMEEWLRHLRVLGEVYGMHAFGQVADSLMGVLQGYEAKLVDARRLRVLILSPEGAGEILSRYHPIASIVARAGGIIPYGADSNRPMGQVPLDSLLAAPPEVIFVPEGNTELVNAFLRQYPEAYAMPAIQYKRIFSIPLRMLAQPYAEPFQAFHIFLQALHPEVAHSPISVQKEDS
ncbi:MAG: hypothetical protein ABDH66_03380 [Bacteroidia bacterium]